MLYQILKKLFPTDLLPAIPKKETLMDIVKQQANNSIDLTSKTLASGYTNLLHFKDSILSYTTGTTVVGNDVEDLNDPEKLLNNAENKSFTFSIPKNHMLNSVDLSGVIEKDVKLIRHRCILFQDFLNELISKENIYSENNILKEFLNSKNVNFLDFIKSYSLLNQTLLSNDVLRLNPSDPLGTEHFYKYLPLPSVTGRGTIPKVVNSKDENSNDNLEEQYDEDVEDGDEEGDGDNADEVFDSDEYDTGDSDSGFAYNGSLLAPLSGRRISEPINRIYSSNASPQLLTTNTRSSTESKRPAVGMLEVDLVSYLERNSEKIQKSDALVKDYKKKVVSRMLKILKKISKDFNSLKMVQESFVDSLQTYHSLDPLMPSYDFQLITKLDQILDELCGQMYYNCLEKIKELDALNDNCLQLIKFSKNKIRQKELLKNLISSESLKLEHLKKKLELESHLSSTDRGSDKEPTPKSLDENNTIHHDTVSENKHINVVDSNQADSAPTAASKFSPFIKKLSSLTSIVKDKYNHTLKPTKDELEAKVVQLQEILSHLEKNEECINDDILFILKQVYGKDIDQFTKKIDDEMLIIINLISEAMSMYSLKSLDIWQEIANRYASY